MNRATKFFLKVGGAAAVALGVSVWAEKARKVHLTRNPPAGYVRTEPMLNSAGVQVGMAFVYPNGDVYAVPIAESGAGGWVKRNMASRGPT